MFRYSAFIVFLLCFYSGLTAGDKTDDDILLLKLDKMIQQRETYQKKVEKDIAELRRTLDMIERGLIFWVICLSNTVPLGLIRR